MEKLFRDYIAVQNLIGEDDRILLAISGGVDSVVMANLFKSSGFKAGLAHANFQLRDSASLRDESHVEDLGKSWGMPFHARRFETKEYALRHGISTQMAARELRYQWFDELLQEYGYSKVATAHHQDDLVETVLLNLVRGTGIRGLHGIKPHWGNVIRPMLFANKEQIIRYASDQDLRWMEDESNEQDHYQRNLIRHQVVPVLKKINPQLESSISQTAEIITAIEKVFDDHMARLKERLLTRKASHNYLPIKSVMAMDAPLFYQLISEFGFNYHQCRNILMSLGGQSGKLFRSTEYQLNIDRTHLVISERDQQTPQGFEISDSSPHTWSHEGMTWTLSTFSGKDYGIRNDKDTGAWDRGKLQFPLKMRKWQSGDWFHPLGMNHKKKVSDFMVDCKIPRNLKDRAQVLLSGDQVIWLVGQRIDDRYKVTSNTQTVLEISVDNPDKE